MKAKKHFGQHFLLSEVVIDQILAAAGEIKDKFVLEVGPGTGNLTKAILSQMPEKLCAVEIDRDCIPYHEKLLLAHKNYSLNIGDALSISEGELMPAPMKVIANLPYNIATPLLFKWLENASLFSDLTLMFQKEVAQRLSAEHNSKKYGKITVLVQLLSKVEYLFDVPKEFFSPQPKIDSAVIRITPYSKPLYHVNDISDLKNMLHILFSQRRKMVHTILKKRFYNVEEVLSQLQINMKLRPEQLSVKQLCDLSNTLI